MKTTFLIAAVLLISTASYSQTSLNSAQSTDVNATAGVNVNSSVLAKTANLARQTGKQTVKEAVAEKQNITSAGKGEVKDLTQTTEHSSQVSAGSQTSAAADASGKSNNSAKDASLNGQSSLSATEAVSGSTDLKNAAKTAIRKTDNETSKSVKKLETETKATSAKTSTKVKAASQPVRPKPVFVKMNTHFATASAIKIK
jgi:hypothetical protein